MESANATQLATSPAASIAAMPAGGGSSDDFYSASSLDGRTHFFGLRVYVVLAVAAAALAILLAAAVTACCFICRRRRQQRQPQQMQQKPSRVASNSGALPAMVGQKEMQVVMSDAVSTSSAGASSSWMWSPSANAAAAMGWGRAYELAEVEAATEGFRPENIIGEGGYGTVYKGLLPDGEVVAVKDLFDHKGQAEKEFTVEVQAIGKVRHKNLVGLIGYCDEGPKRILIYEFLNNGNLEQWLHGDVGQFSPVTWELRMKIAVGTAKGIAYLHEGLEPKVVHRDIKASNILLDKHWNAKVSDFGMAKLLGSETAYVTTRVMGTFGYVSPEYASTGMLNESSDVYSFGVLLMELISGRSPIDYNRPAGEVNLVEWFKGMVGGRRIEELVDPMMEVAPPPRVLNRVLLVCLRCIDNEAQKRPKMGQVVHMLEGEEFPFRMEHRSPRATTPTRPIPHVQSSKRTIHPHNVVIVDPEKPMSR